MKWKLLPIAALLAGGILAWVNRGQSKPQSDPLGLTAVAERRDIESDLLLTGEVTPAFQVEVKPEVGGKVKEIHTATGKEVQRGDLLVTIDDTDLLNEKAAAETTIDGAQLAVDKARGNYERAKALFEQKLISKEVFANLEADFDIAENSLDKAGRSLKIVQDKLAKTRIVAPADGTVLDVAVNEGQVVVAAASVNAGTVVMMFADLSRLMINSHVNQADAPRLSTGLPVEVMVSSGETPVRAHIEFIAPLATVKNNIKGFEVQAAIENADSRLKPGMSVSMNVPVGRASSAVSVPVTAVFRDSKENVVYVRKGRTTEKRKVHVGLSNLSFAEIKSGIEEGEEVLLVEPSAVPSKS